MQTLADAIFQPNLRGKLMKTPVSVGVLISELPEVRNYPR